MKRRDLLAAGAAVLATPAWVGAQSTWPARGPIRLVAQFPPGGLVDTVSRLMAPHLSQALGQTVLVENRAGAGGLIGTDYVSKQPADGCVELKLARIRQPGWRVALPGIVRQPGPACCSLDQHRPL